MLHSDQVQFSGVAPMLIYVKELDKVISVAGLGHWPKAGKPNLEFFKKEHGGRIPLGILRTIVLVTQMPG